MSGVIPVSALLPSRTYDTPEAAIRGAYGHPLQPKAREDGARLIGAAVADAWWTEAEHAVAFSNGLFLHVRAEADEVAWTMTESPPVLPGEVGRIGSPPVVLDWGTEVGRHPMDRSALAEKRLGAEVYLLFVNEMGLLLYCRRHLIWWFSAARRTDLDRPVLYVTEEE